MVVDNIEFVGSGRNKKLAKSRAALNALEKLFEMEFTDTTGRKSSQKIMGWWGLLI